MSLNGSPPDVGRRVAAIRAQRGLSQGTVARLAKLGPSYLSRIECGKTQPTFPTLWRLLVALRADFTELLGPEANEKGRNASCPVSIDGRCLLDLIRSDAEVARSPRGTYVSPHEVQVLHDLARWLESAPVEKARAVEFLIHSVTGNAR